jgi:hypothetical protein
MTTQDREVVPEVIMTGTANSTMVKLPVRISDSNWSGLKDERTKIGAILKNTHDDLSWDELRAIGYPQAHQKPPEGG